MDVISALLGIPEEDREEYRHAVDKGLNRDPDAQHDATSARSRRRGRDRPTSPS
jgi:cytochrome P450